MWDRGIQILTSESGGTSSFVAYTHTIFDYLPRNSGRKPGDHAVSDQINHFQDTGELGALAEPLQVAIRDLLPRIIGQAPLQSVVIVPVPSSTNEPHEVTRILAEQVGRIGNIRVESDSIRINSFLNVAPQTPIRHLWFRLANMGNSVRFSNPRGVWRDRIVIFVDDVGTTGATEASVRQFALVKGQASSVHFIRLGGTR